MFTVDDLPQMPSIVERIMSMHTCQKLIICSLNGTKTGVHAKFESAHNCDEPRNQVDELGSFDPRLGSRVRDPVSFSCFLCCPTCMKDISLLL